mgnify:CR=1 FL=1
MLAYIVRRVLYAVPILVGVNLLTFALFFIVNSPDDMARMQLGAKRVTPRCVDQFKETFPDARVYAASTFDEAKLHADELVKSLPNIIFCGGGDGTGRGARRPCTAYRHAARRGGLRRVPRRRPAALSVIGVSPPRRCRGPTPTAGL